MHIKELVALTGLAIGTVESECRRLKRAGRVKRFHDGRQAHYEAKTFCEEKLCAHNTDMVCDVGLVPDSLGTCARFENGMIGRILCGDGAQGDKNLGGVS